MSRVILGGAVVYRCDHPSVSGPASAAEARDNCFLNLISEARLLHRIRAIVTARILALITN